MTVRRTLFVNVGKFDVRFGPGTAIVVDDVDFIFRAFKQGLKIVAHGILSSGKPRKWAIRWPPIGKR
jgi:hypothetical protein